MDACNATRRLRRDGAKIQLRRYDCSGIAHVVATENPFDEPGAARRTEREHEPGGIMHAETVELIGRIDELWLRQVIDIDRAMQMPGGSHRRRPPCQTLDDRRMTTLVHLRHHGESLTLDRLITPRRHAR